MAIVEAVAKLVGDVESDIGRRGVVGVGAPGAISTHTGLVKNSNTVVVNGKPLDVDLAQALGRSVRVANDANCFALSEAVDGAGRGAGVVFGVILGTGVGGGVVVDGRIVEGRNRVAGEWGHTPLPWMTPQEYPGAPCFCGHKGCIETFLCGAGLSRDYEQRSGARRPATEIAALADGGRHWRARDPRALSGPSGAGPGDGGRSDRSRRDRARRRSFEYLAAL